jgi:hypothetical protein
LEPPFQPIHDQVMEAANAAGFSNLDVTPYFLRDGGDLGRWRAACYDMHPSAAANRLVARYLADHLLEGVQPTSSVGVDTAAAAGAR